MSQDITNPFAACIANTNTLNAFQDITWTLQYTLCGNQESQGGFCTFLYDATVPNVTMGGIGKSLGYTPSQDYTATSNVSGVSGAVIGIGFDTSGLFATSGNGIATGIDFLAAVPDTLTIRTGTDFTYLTSIALSSLDSSFQLQHFDTTLEQLRFRLTNAGNLIEIARWNNNAYNVLLEYPVSLGIAAASACKVGVSFASPLCGAVVGAKFGVANFHIEGIQQQPTIAYKTEPVVCTFPIISNITTIPPQSVAIIPTKQPIAGTYVVTQTTSAYVDPCGSVLYAPNIKCGDTVNYNGIKGTQYYYVDVGESVGSCSIDYNAYDIPDRFTMTWGDNSYTTCFVGASSYNSQLHALGFGSVAGPGAGNLKFYKDKAFPTIVGIRVDAPLDGTLWAFKANCIKLPTPSLQLYDGLSTASGDLIQLGNSIFIGTFIIGQSIQRYFTIKNGGDGDLSSFTLIQELSASISQYRITPDIQQQTLTPGQTASFGVLFRPTLLDENDSRIDVYSNDPNQTPFTFNLSAVVLSNSIPLCSCGTFFSVAGGVNGITSYNINYGPSLGNISLDYSSFDKPNSFTLVWNGVSASSGFIGNASYNAALTAIGYPVVAGTGTGRLSTFKSAEFPTHARLVINSPLTNTSWNVQTNCIYGGVAVESDSILDTLLA